MEETIELRQLINMLLKGKWVIALCTIVGLLIAGIVSWMVLDERYKSEAVVQISSNVEDASFISKYISNEYTTKVFMQRIQNTALMTEVFQQNNYSKFKNDYLIVSNEENTDLVMVSYESESSKDAQQSVQLLLDKTKLTMNESIQSTLGSMEQTYLNESEMLSSEIEILMDRYNEVVISNKLPEVLILQTISSTQFVLNLTEQQTAALSNISGTLQNELLQLKAQIDTKSDEYRAVLTKYQSVKTGLDSFNADPFIRVIVEPTLSEEPASPNKLLNVAIGLILGFMLGVGFVFFREYWRNSSMQK